MRYQRNIFLAGATALAFAAAVGFASAQEASHKAKAPQATMQSSQAGKMSKQSRATTKTKGVKSAQRVNRGKKTARLSKRPGYAMHKKTASTRISKHPGYAMQKQNRGAMYQGRANRRGKFAAQNKGRFTQRNRARFAQQNKGLKGLQGNAAAPPMLSPQQRTTIRNTVFNAPRAPRAAQAPFAVAVGTTIPRTFHVAPVPGTLIRIYPGWRGMRYFVFQDEVVIVNPYTFQIVAVVPV